MSSKRKSRGLYARLMGDWHAHPKVLGLSLEARGLWASLASWSAHGRTDGIFTVGHAAALAQGKHARPLRELREAVLVDDLGEGRFRLHGWEEYNMTRDEHEAWKAADAERKRLARAVGKGGSVRADSGRTPSGFRRDSGWSPGGVRTESHSHAPRERSYPSEGGYPYHDAVEREENLCGPAWGDEEAAQ